MYFHITTGTTTKPTIAEVATTTTQETLSEEIGGLARQYNVNAELATRIIKCESNNNPEAVRYDLHSEDLGYFQLNTKFQGPTLKKEGLNILNPKDNLKYGFELLSREGTTPWNWSKECWG